MGEAKFYYQNEHAMPTSIGVVAIIKQNGGILLERRSDSDRWAIIGGAVQEESFVEALRREVKEETGLTVRDERLFGTFSDPSRIIAFPDGNIKRIITLAYEVEVEPYTEILCSNESKEVRFVPEDRLSHIRIAETHLPIIQSILEGRGVVLE